MWGGGRTFGVSCTQVQVLSLSVPGQRILLFDLKLRSKTRVPRVSRHMTIYLLIERSSLFGTKCSTRVVKCVIFMTVIMVRVRWLYYGNLCTNPFVSIQESNNLFSSEIVELHGCKRRKKKGGGGEGGEGG